jgi:hypothetical protein
MTRSFEIGMAILGKYTLPNRERLDKKVCEFSLRHEEKTDHRLLENK